MVQLVAYSSHNLRIASSNPDRVTSRFFFWQGTYMHMPVNTAVRAVVRSPGKAAPLGVLGMRVGTLTSLYILRFETSRLRASTFRRFDVFPRQ